MPTKSASQLPCGWADIRFRSFTSQEDGLPLDASFIKTEPYREQFRRKAQEGEVFALALPGGRYEIHAAEIACIVQPSIKRNFTYTASKTDPIEFEVVPGKVTYLGAITFEAKPSFHGPGGMTVSSGASLVIEDHWDRDGRLLENNYPLIDWNETVMSNLAGPVRRKKDDAPLPRTLERVIEEPFAPAASKQERKKDCEGGAAEGCFDLGLHYWKERQSYTDENLAATHFETACKGGIAQACFNLGTLQLQGWGVPDPDLGGAARLFDKACKSGTAWGCLSLGSMYEEGLGGVYLPQDRAKAASLYQKACKAGSAEGCFALGMLHIKKQALDKSTRQALPLFEQSCANGFRRACFAVAQLKGE